MPETPGPTGRNAALAAAENLWQAVARQLEHCDEEDDGTVTDKPHRPIPRLAGYGVGSVRRDIEQVLHRLLVAMLTDEGVEQPEWAAEHVIEAGFKSDATSVGQVMVRLRANGWEL